MKENHSQTGGKEILERMQCDGKDRARRERGCKKRPPSRTRTASTIRSQKAPWQTDCVFKNLCAHVCKREKEREKEKIRMRERKGDEEEGGRWKKKEREKGQKETQTAHASSDPCSHLFWLLPNRALPSTYSS